MSRLRALLATLRIANAPSVVSNVWLGYMVGWYLWFGSWIPTDTGMILWQSLGGLCLAGLLLYFAGNLANDWHDRHWDQSKRPERALPSGLFRPVSYLAAAILCALTGAALAFRENIACGITAVAIVVLISIYTRFHKRSIWSVVPMGLCRSGLYFLGFLAFWLEIRESLLVFGPSSVFRGWVILLMGLGLLSYIAGLSLSARYEGMPDAPQGPRVISMALLILPALAMTCWFSLLGLAGILPFAIWLGLCFTRFKKPIPRYVSALLAGIPLVDLLAAIPLSVSVAFIPGNGAVNMPLALAIVAVPLAAFVLGRLLQKVAPAT